MEMAEAGTGQEPTTTVYVFPTVNSKRGLSPAELTWKNVAKKTKLDQTQENAITLTRGHLERKLIDFTQQHAVQDKEGMSYETGVTTKEPMDSLHLLPLTPQLTPQPVIDYSGKIFFDLETTGLSRTSDIVQLAAVCGDKTFNKYILPNQIISPKVTAVTGFTVVDGELCYKGVAVPTTTIHAALVHFMEFIQSCGSSKPILFGHSIKRFDVHVLYHALNSNNMVEEFGNHMAGFVDTLLLARKVIEKSEVQNYRQVTLVRRFLKKEYEAHNALNDVMSLAELYCQTLAGKCDISKHVFTLHSHTLRQSLNTMVEKRCLSAAMATKMAESGLGLSHLKLAYKHDPTSGIRNLLGEPVDGKKVRVTKAASAIAKINDYIAQLGDPN